MLTVFRSFRGFARTSESEVTRVLLLFRDVELRGCKGFRSESSLGPGRLVLGFGLKFMLDLRSWLSGHHPGSNHFKSFAWMAYKQ